MSGVIQKIKDALHSTSNDRQRDGSTTSATNPGVLRSSKPGIHGQRDPASGTTRGLATPSGRPRGDSAHGGLTPANTIASLAPRDHTDPFSNASDDTAVAAGGEQFTSDNALDAELAGSGPTASRATTTEETGAGISGAGEGYEGAGTGSGLRTFEDAETGTGLDGGGSGRGASSSSADTEGDAVGSGFSSNERETRFVGDVEVRPEDGKGLFDERRKDAGDEVAGSGLSGTEGTVAGGRYGGDEVGSGLDGKPVAGGDAAQSFREESERLGKDCRHRDTGHPEDILHPGPHVTGAAAKLDPHLQ